MDSNRKRTAQEIREEIEKQRQKIEEEKKKYDKKMSSLNEQEIYIKQQTKKATEQQQKATNKIADFNRHKHLLDDEKEKLSKEMTENEAKGKEELNKLQKMLVEEECVEQGTSTSFSGSKNFCINIFNICY